MRSAKALGCIAAEQAGGCKHHKANETVLNSRIILDDSCFHRKAMANYSNNAKGYFDHIVHSVAYICLCKFGIPPQSLHSMFTVIQKMTPHICTAVGDEHPYMGALQGNGTAGTVWTTVSSVIIHTMKSLGFGYHTCTAITAETIHLRCFAFVDNTDLVHSGSPNLKSASQVHTEMQNVSDHWDGLLQATGGALKKAKVIGIS